MPGGCRGFEFGVAVSSQTLLVLVPALLAVSAAGAVPLARRFGARAGYPLAAVLAVAGGLLASLVPRVLTGPVSMSVPWVGPLDAGWDLHLDGLSLIFGLVVTFVGAVVVAYSVQYVNEGHDPVRYFAAITGFAAAMMLLVLAGDGLVLYVGWEATTLTSFVLIASGGRRAAARALLLTFSGGLALLGAVLLGAAHVGTLSLGRLADPGVWGAGPTVLVFLGLLVVAAAVKSAQVPFHPWLLGAMVAPAPVSAYLHAAAMVTAGLYLLLRFGGLIAAQPVVAAVVVVIGTATAVFASAAALRRSDVKELLAYSTVGQLGFMFALVGVGRAAAVAGAIVYFVSHATYKSSLFLSAGIYDRLLGSRAVGDLSGSAAKLPATTAGLLTGCFAMAGLIPALAFVGKEEAFRGLLSDPSGPQLIGTVGIVAALSLTVAYSIRLGVAPLRRADAHAQPADPGDLTGSRAMASSVVLLAVVSVTLGLVSGALTPLVDAAVASSLGRPPEGSLGLWHGPTPAFVTSVAIWVAGAALFAVWFRRGWWRMLPDAVGAALWDRIAELVRRTGAQMERRLSDPRPGLHLAVFVAVGSTLLWLALPVSWDVGDVGIGDSGMRWVVSLLLGAAAVAVARARDRLTSLAVLAGVGFVIAVWYVIHGAPQLAAVQLVVDGLTVALALFVLRHLPRSYPPVSRRRRFGAGVLAVVGGGAFAGLSLVSRAAGLPAASEAYIAHARSSSTGNIVTGVLSDFRALDTLGETTVIAVAALGVVTAVGRVGLQHVDTVIAGISARLVTPLVLVLSAWLLLRGHFTLGGGFLAATVVGLAVVLRHLTVGSVTIERALARGAPTFVGAGLVAMVGYGAFGGLWGDGFLDAKTVHVTVPLLGRLPVPSTLLFEGAVAMAVLAVVAAVIHELGSDR